MFSLLLISALVLGTGTAMAESVCIARSGTVMDLPRAIVAEGSRMLGKLDHRRCYPVMERLDGVTRILVSEKRGFHGEVEVADSALAQILTDDIEMVSKEGAEVFGGVLSGALVVVESEPGSSDQLATLVEGRLGARFLVGVDDVYPAQKWPVPDPDESGGASWPVAELPLPPTADGLLDDPMGMQLRAELRSPSFAVTELRNDPGLGLWRMNVQERTEEAARVQIVGPTAWAEGWVVGSAWTREPPVAGYEGLSGLVVTAPQLGGPREVGAKPAPLYRGPKGVRVGALQPGARLEVLAAEKGWLEVVCRWEHGEARGWVEKKRLVKEGKEGPIQHRFEGVAGVHLARTALQWMSPEDHREEREIAAEPSVLESGESEQRRLESFVPEPKLEISAALARLRSSLPRLQWLYAQGLLMKPALSGEVTVRVVVDPTGEILEAGVFSSSFTDQAVADQIATDLSALSFDRRRLPRRKRGQPKRDWRVIFWAQYLFSPAPAVN
ncbi:MAG: hypothetical protein CMP23_13080 [Rickettsiales bacterium]|nr:hypothetical protein [Rickettsiales bacterium]